MKLSLITHSRQRRRVREQGFSDLRPIRWNNFNGLLVQQSDRKKWDIFPLELAKWWREQPGWLRFIAIALIGINLALATLSLIYRLMGQ